MSKQNYRFNENNRLFMNKLTNLLEYYYKGKFNQAIASRDLNISKQTLNYYINGSRVPGFLHLQHILDFCRRNIKNFNPNYFFFENEPITKLGDNFHKTILSTTEIDTINQIVNNNLTNEFKVILSQQKELLDFLNTLKDIFIHYAHFRSQCIIKMIDFDASIFFQIQYSILESRFKDLFLKTISDDSFSKYFLDLEKSVEDLTDEELNKKLIALNEEFINLLKSNKKDSTN